MLVKSWGLMFPDSTAHLTETSCQGACLACHGTRVLHAIQAAVFGSPCSWLMQAQPAGLHRQCLFGGLRIGLYDPVKSFYVKTLGIDPTQDAPFLLKVASGLTTGALGIAIASPTDLVKVSCRWSALETHRLHSLSGRHR